MRYPFSGPQNVGLRRPHLPSLAVLAPSPWEPRQVGRLPLDGPMAHVACPTWANLVGAAHGPLTILEPFRTFSKFSKITRWPFEDFKTLSEIHNSFGYLSEFNLITSELF